MYTRRHKRWKSFKARIMLYTVVLTKEGPCQGPHSRCDTSMCGSVCVSSVWVCVSGLYIEIINGTEVLLWLRCISQMLTIDYSFQSFLNNTVLLLATANIKLLRPMPLLTLYCYWRCRDWSHATPGDAIAKATCMLLLVMPWLKLCDC